MTNELMLDYRSSDVEDIIKNYLKENLSIELDWDGYEQYWSAEKLVIKLLLDGEEILKTTAYKP